MPFRDVPSRRLNADWILRFSNLWVLLSQTGKLVRLMRLYTLRVLPCSWLRDRAAHPRCGSRIVNSRAQHPASAAMLKPKVPPFALKKKKMQSVAALVRSIPSRCFFFHTFVCFFQHVFSVGFHFRFSFAASMPFVHTYTSN